MLFNIYNFFIYSIVGSSSVGDLVESTLDLPDLTLGSTEALGTTYNGPELASLDLLNDTDMEQLSLEIEKERVEYLEKSRNLQNQLKHLKSEMEVCSIRVFFAMSSRTLAIFRLAVNRDI